MMVEDKAFRIVIARDSFYWFFRYYFRHYTTSPTGAFQKQIFEDLQDWEKAFIEIIAFRGSAKSTMASLALPIWAVISNRAKFPIIAGDTGIQAKLHIYNLKTELEDNDDLIRDFGPFEESDEWTATSIVLPRYNARIMSTSTGKKIRGARHKQYRPDLLIVDDIENLESVRTKEQRDKNQRWFLGEAMSALSDNPKTVLIGNLLHTDSFMMRMKKQILNGERDGIVREYPIIYDNGKITWVERYPDMGAINKKKNSVRDPSGNPEKTWNREYLLKIVPEDGQIVKEEWIKKYDRLPDKIPLTRGIGIDLAISKKDTADYTTMVAGKLYEVNGAKLLYILPNPVNKRLSFRETIAEAERYSKAVGDGVACQLYVEDVAYQRAAVEELTLKSGLPARGIKIDKDKASRLSVAANYVQSGQVLFPAMGCEDLINQILNFGVEAHDDLVDGFTLLVGQIFQSQVNIRIA